MVPGEMKTGFDNRDRTVISGADHGPILAISPVDWPVRFHNHTADPHAVFPVFFR